MEKKDNRIVWQEGYNYTVHILVGSESYGDESEYYSDTITLFYCRFITNGGNSRWLFIRANPLEKKELEPRFFKGTLDSSLLSYLETVDNLEVYSPIHDLFQFREKYGSLGAVECQQQLCLFFPRKIV
jgi:hypothetical protein